MACDWAVQERTRDRYDYMIPIARVTGSRVKVFEWAQRMLKQLSMIGEMDGWLFRGDDRERRALASDYA